MIIFYNESGDILEVNHQTNTPFFNEELFTLEEVLQGYADRGLKHKVLEEMGQAVTFCKVVLDDNGEYLRLREMTAEEFPLPPAEDLETEKKALENRVEELEQMFSILLDEEE